MVIADHSLLMKDANKLLEFRIDGLMERCRLMRPAFHRDYVNARMVVYRGAPPAPAPKVDAAKNDPAKAA